MHENTLHRHGMWESQQTRIRKDHKQRVRLTSKTIPSVPLKQPLLLAKTYAGVWLALIVYDGCVFLQRMNTSSHIAWGLCEMDCSSVIALKLNPKVFFLSTLAYCERTPIVYLQVAKFCLRVPPEMTFTTACVHYVFCTSQFLYKVLFAHA